MPSSMTITGLNQLAQRLRRLEAQTMPALATALHQRAEQIMAGSQQEDVPVVTGRLRDSGIVYPPQATGAHIEVVLGYTASYAAEVHSNPRAGKTGGFSPSGYPYPPGTYSTVGHWHFLSEPIDEAAATYVQDLATMVGQVLRRAL